jgi:hypothetical protein
MCENPGDIPGAHVPLKSGAYEATVVNAVVAHAAKNAKNPAKCRDFFPVKSSDLPDFLLLVIVFIVLDFLVIVLDIVIVGIVVGGWRSRLKRWHDAHGIKDSNRNVSLWRRPLRRLHPMRLLQQVSAL